MTDFAATKSQFHLPANLVYLDGNSLGPLPLRAAERVARTVQAEWGDLLITGWNKAGWMDKPLSVGNRIARLIGPNPIAWPWATPCRSRSIRPSPRPWK